MAGVVRQVHLSMDGSRDSMVTRLPGRDWEGQNRTGQDRIERHWMDKVRHELTVSSGQGWTPQIFTSLDGS